MQNDKIGVKLENYQLTLAQAEVIDLFKEIGTGEVTIKLQNADPVQVLSCKDSILISKRLEQRREARK